jgi:hypothetical protein
MTPSRPPRFSILVPTHNRADVLPFAIRSVLWQTRDDFELLVVGDGCTDATSEVVASFGDPRIRWFDLPKAPGIGYANRNVGLREARGEYVAYLAHDDLWFPDHLERLGALLDETGAEFAYSRGLAVGVDGRVMPYWYNLGVPGHQAGLSSGETAITLCTVVHTRACLLKYGYWDESLLRSADKELWHRILARGEFKNLAFLSEPTSLHFVADWRNTGSYRARTRMAGSLSNGFLDQVLPDALRLPAAAEQVQQEAAWQRLVADPSRKVREIREGVVRLHDQLLWKTRTPFGLVGLRAGLVLGAALDRLARGLLWILSPERRRLGRRLRVRTKPLASARR